MPLHRLSRLSKALAWGLLIASSGCERSTPAPRGDTRSPPSDRTPAATTPATISSGWNTAAGSVLLIQGEVREEAIVLLPSEGDTAAATRFEMQARQGATATLFGRGGAQLTAQLGPTATKADAECRIWPLQDVRSEGTADHWAVGFLGAQVAPLALDSVETLTSRDSMVLAAEASRLASEVTAPTAPSFQGLRFAAHDIRRFETSPGVQALVAHVVRKVNQEANPQEEQTLLIAERDSGVTSGPYHLAYAERTHGLEEQVTNPEVIAAVLLAGRPTLVVARDSDAGVAYVMIERIGTRQWRFRWTSAPTGCA